MFSSKSAEAAQEEKRAVPLATYAAFLLRDMLIIGAGFIPPAIVAGGLQSATGMERLSAEEIAQLATPCCMQIVITPIHLLGLNLYNMPTASAAERFRDVR